MQRKPQASGNAKNVWLLRQSTRFPGEYYCFNTATGEAMWCRNEDRPSFSRSFDNDANLTEDTAYYHEPSSPPHSQRPTNAPTFPTMPTYLPGPTNLNPMYANVWPISNNQKMFLVPALPIFVPNSTNTDSRTDRITQTSRPCTPIIANHSQATATKRKSEISHTVIYGNGGNCTLSRPNRPITTDLRIDEITQTSRTNSPIVAEAERLKTKSLAINNGNAPNSTLGHSERADNATTRERTKSMSTQTVDSEVAVTRKRTSDNLEKKDDGPQVKIGKKADSLTDLTIAEQFDPDIKDSPSKPLTTNKAVHSNENTMDTQHHDSSATAGTEAPNNLGPMEAPAVGNLAKDDLRYKLMAIKRKAPEVAPMVLESSAAKPQGPSPPKSAEPAAVKKKVTFNLPAARPCDSLSSISSEVYFEDREGAYAQLSAPSIPPQEAYNTSKLRSLAHAHVAGQCWYIAADIDVLLSEFGFIEDLVKSDQQCRLMMPSVVQSQLDVLSQGSSAGRQNVLAARQVSRRLDSSNFVLHEAKKNASNEEGGIIECCERYNVVLITNQETLHTKASNRDITCLSVDAVKKLVTHTEPLLFEAKKIQITVKNNSIKDTNNSLSQNDELTNDARDKRKWTKEIRYLDDSLDVAKTKKKSDPESIHVDHVGTMLQENTKATTNGDEHKHGKNATRLDDPTKEATKVRGHLTPILTKDLKNRRSAEADKLKKYQTILKRFAKESTGIDLEKLLTKTAKVILIRCDHELKAAGCILPKNTKEKMLSKSTEQKEKTKTTPPISDKKSRSEKTTQLQNYNDQQSNDTDKPTPSPQKRFKLTLKRREKKSAVVNNQDNLPPINHQAATNGNEQESTDAEITTTPQPKSPKITLKRIDKKFIVVNNLVPHAHRNTDSATKDVVEESANEEKTTPLQPKITKIKRKSCETPSAVVTGTKIITTVSAQHERENEPITRPNAESNSTFASTTTTLSSEITWVLDDSELRAKSPILSQKTCFKPINDTSRSSLLTNGLCQRLKRVQDSIILKAVVDGFENELEKFCEVDLPEEKFARKKDEWLCSFLQILEDALTCLVHTTSRPAPDPLAPFLLEEVLRAVRQAYSVLEASIDKRLRLACDQISALFVYATGNGEFVRIKANVRVKELMRALCSGVILIQTLLTLDPTNESLLAAAQSLDRLVNDVKEPGSVPDVSLFDFKVKVSYKAGEDYVDHVRQKITKQPSEILEYIERHYASWEEDANTQMNGNEDANTQMNGNDEPQTKTEELTRKKTATGELEPRTKSETKQEHSRTCKIIRTFGRNLDKLRLQSGTIALDSPVGGQRVDLTTNSVPEQAKDRPAKPLVVTFLVEVGDLFTLVFNFVKTVVKEFQDGVREHRQRVLSRKANRTRRVITTIKDKLQSIVEREESDSEGTLKAVAAKAGLNWSDIKLSRYKQVVLKLLEQADILNGCLNAIVDLGNGNNIDLNSVEKACQMNYINIFDNVC